jgi:hypothetical protein
MPLPTDFKQQVFEATNGYNPHVHWAFVAGGNKRSVIAVPAPNASDGQGPSAVEGYCFCATCNWIKLSIQHGIEQSSQVMSANQILFASIVQSGAKRAAREEHLDEAAIDALVYERYGLKKEWRLDVDDGADLKEFFKRVKKTAAEYGQSVPLLHFRFHVPRHSMGLAFDFTTRSCYLFDPNYGLYQYDVTRNKGVFEHAYTNYPSGNEEEWDWHFSFLTLETAE